VYQHQHPRRLACAFAAIVLTAQLFIGAAPVVAAPVANALVGRVTDDGGAPLADVVVVASGTSSNAAVTDHDGKYTMDLDPGTYEISASKDGYTPKAVSGVVIAAASVTLNLTLAKMQGGAKSVAISTQTSINGSASTYHELPDSVIGLSYASNLNDLVAQLPGVTLVQSTGAGPDSSFELRGGVIETTTQIDGHPISSGAYGRWNSHYADAQLFDKVSAFSGPGFFGVTSGQDGFGIVDLQTATFVNQDRYLDFKTGVDQWNGSYTSLTLGGNLFANGRLSYIFQDNVAGYRGPFDNQLADEVVTGPNNTAVIAFVGALNSRYDLDSQTAKLRYRLSPNVSITAAYTGIQSDYIPQGATYGVFTGYRTIVGSLQTPGGLLFNAPYAQNQIGSYVPTYQWFPASESQTNQPLFDQEIRIANKADTFLIRPYQGTIYSTTDGLGRGDFPQGANNNAWFQVVDPGLCSSAQPCYQGTNPNPMIGPSSNCSQLEPCYSPNYDTPYVSDELDRLHGYTLTYIHPVASNTYTIGYDYHSDQTSAYAGNPDPAANTAGTIAGDAFQTVVAPTTSRNYDVEAIANWQLSSKLHVSLADYYTSWNLAYQIEDPAVIAANPGKGLDIPLALINQNRKFYFNNPRLGIAFAPSRSTSLRFTTGESLTYPYAILVSGVPNITLPSSANDEIGTLNLPNAALNPEKTWMFDLGIDHISKYGTLFSSDLFDYTTHDPFVLQTQKDVGPIIPGTGLPQYSLSAQTINAGVKYNYGIELSLSNVPQVGFGFRTAMVFQRAFFEELPDSLYAASASQYINGKQLDGEFVTPYFRGYVGITHGWQRGSLLDFGFDMIGSNNYTYGPGFILAKAVYRQPITSTLSVTASIDNAFNYVAGSNFAAANANAGFGIETYGPGPKNTFVYGSAPTDLQSVTPRTFRVQLDYKPKIRE
jgi:hypothetical protein